MSHEPTDKDDVRAADMLAAEQLDHERSATEAEWAALSPPERTRWADLVWLDILLEQIEHPDRYTADRERRVGRVLSTLAAEFDEPAETLPMTAAVTPTKTPRETPALPLRRRQPRHSFWPYGLAAAAALLAAFLLRSGSPRSQAYARVEQAVAVAQRPVDRQYQVAVKVAGGATAQSMLYIRGGERFCLKHPAPLGELWVGGDRQQSWFVPALAFLPVRVSNDPALIREFLREGDVSLTPQVLQVTSILSRLADKDRYDLELLPPETLPGLNGEPIELARIHGQRGEVSSVWPAVIDLWANPQTGQMVKMRLGWDPGAGIEQIELHLVGEEPQPEDWYEHARHHQPGRAIIEVGGQPSAQRALRGTIQ